MPIFALAALLFAAPAAAHTCELALDLGDSPPIGAMQLVIDYSMASGSFVHPDGKMVCSSDVNALAPFQDDPGIRVVYASFISLSGFAGPVQLAHCSFDDPSGTTAGSNFVVYATETTDPASNAIAAPRIHAVLGSCDDPTTTTTLAPATTITTTTTSTTSTTSTTATSTTLPTTSTTIQECGNGYVEGLEECDDGNTKAGDGCEPDCTVAGDICGDANDNDSLQASDALMILRAAIGQPITCPYWLCDTDGDRKLLAADSLRALKRAVGQSVVMSCPTQP